MKFVRALTFLSFLMLFSGLQLIAQQERDDNSSLIVLWYPASQTAIITIPSTASISVTFEDASISVAENGANGTFKLQIGEAAKPVVFPIGAKAPRVFLDKPDIWIAFGRANETQSRHGGCQWRAEPQVSTLHSVIGEEAERRDDNQMRFKTAE